jgi:hypothetical protein
MEFKFCFYYYIIVGINNYLLSKYQNDDSNNLEAHSHEIQIFLDANSSFYFFLINVKDWLRTFSIPYLN